MTAESEENTAPVSERGGWVMVPRDLPARIRRQIDATRHYLIQTGIDGHFAEVLLSHYGDFAREIEKAASPAVEGLHPATVDLVQRFSVALSAKLRKAELKYGYDDGWAQPDWEDDCRRALGEHVLKGDPLDVAAYAAFCWHHGWSTAPARQIAALQGSEGGHAGKLESAPTGGASHLLGGERARLVCPECGGDGCFDREPYPTPNGPHYPEPQVCRRCDGSGEVPAEDGGDYTWDDVS